MPESMPQMSPKLTFVIGLLGGVAVVSTIGFFVLLPRVLNTDGGPLAVKNTGDTVAPSADAPALPPPTGELPPIGDDDYIRGNKNAKVTLVEYSDFECPFCLRHKPTIDKIMADYKDQVRFVYRHFPLSFHPQAQKAAEAYECAGEQGKAYEMHDRIFDANQAGTMGVEMWKTIAKDLKLNTTKFNECLDTGRMAAKISAQMAGGASAGVNGTPATFVNGRIVSGAVPYEQFKQIIDSLL